MVFEQILSSYNRNLITQLIMVGVILIWFIPVLSWLDILVCFKAAIVTSIIKLGGSVFPTKYFTCTLHSGHKASNCTLTSSDFMSDCYTTVVQ